MTGRLLPAVDPAWESPLRYYLGLWLEPAGKNIPSAYRPGSTRNTRCSSALCQDTWRFNQKGLFGIMGSNLGRTSPPNSRRDFTIHLSLACISPRDFFPDNPRAPIGSVGHDEQKAFLALVQGDRNQ
jgi:hypothetical protein